MGRRLWRALSTAGLFVWSGAAALGQGGNLGLPSTPPPGQVGDVPPLAAAANVVEMPPFMARSLASYAGHEARSHFLPSLFRGNADLKRAVGLADPIGPVALFIPGVPGADDGAESPFGWLFLRYGEPLGPKGPFTDAQVGHIVIPGPMKITFLPLRFGTVGGRPEVEALGQDDQSLFTLPLLSGRSQNEVSMGLGARGDGDERSVAVTANGYTAVISVGLPSEDQVLPRPEYGKLRVGDPAPDFELKRVKADGTVRLSSFHSKQPVVLIFGSFT